MTVHRCWGSGNLPHWLTLRADYKAEIWHTTGTPDAQKACGFFREGIVGFVTRRPANTSEELESPLTDQSRERGRYLLPPAVPPCRSSVMRSLLCRRQIITAQCSNHGRLCAGWAAARAWSMVSKSPTRMSLCFVRHCPKLSAMTRNFPRGAFLSMSFVTLLPPAACCFYQFQAT